MKPEEPVDLGAWSDCLEPVEPLPGGLQALRARIDQEKNQTRRHRRWLRFALAAACAASVALCWVLPSSDQRTSRLEQLFTAKGQLPPPPVDIPGVLSEAAQPLRAEDPRIQETDEVVFFWVSSRKATGPDTVAPVLHEPEELELTRTPGHGP